MSEMLEKILSDENIKTAYKRVYANKGAGGVDGVTVGELEEYLKENWNSIKQQIRERKYKPQPVLRVEIPKSNGGVRKLGVPKWIAHKVANWGDHYQFVATKSVLARAISKEKLTKCGLVSVFDYYQKVHI